MPVNRHKRQILLFLVAILVPAAVLIGLAGRLVYQDRELAAKRAVDQRRTAVDQLRRELSARLDAITLQEINRLIRSRNSEATPDSSNPAVVFAATIEGDRLVLPWDAPPVNASPDFARHRMEGEALEFMKRDFAGAAAAYRAALASARRPQEAGEARMLLARTLSKAGNTEEAFRQYETLLGDASGAKDDQGVGYRFYAAERLVEAKHNPEAVFRFLHKEVSGEGRLTLPELYMIRTLLGSVQDERLAQRIAETEQAVALTRDFPRVRARIESGAASGTVWVPYGTEPWLVTITPPTPPFPGLVLVVSSLKATPPGVILLSRTESGDALGDAFPGLRVE
jgi:tetratricopeptide (TPR) repeat protein